MNYPTAEVLRIARTLYASAPAHTPVADYPESGTYCLVTAISEAAEQARLIGSIEYWDYDIPLDVVRKEIEAQYGKVEGVVQFNAEHTTYEVLEVLDGAIRAAA